MRYVAVGLLLGISVLVGIAGGEVLWTILRFIHQ